MASTQPVYQPYQPSETSSYDMDSKKPLAGSEQDHSSYSGMEQQLSSHTESTLPSLDIDFSWGKMRSRISESGTPADAPATYILHYNAIKIPTLIFKSGDDQETIATGHLNAFSINCKTTLRGNEIPIKAIRRLHTEYAYTSHNIPGNSAGPSTVYWSGNSDMKQWHFVCMDENKLPIAKFSANWWSLTKVGKFEFLGAKATGNVVRDELVATGITVFYCMVLRTQSLPSLLGAIFARPGKEKSKLEAERNGYDEQGIELKKTS